MAACRGWGLSDETVWAMTVAEPRVGAATQTASSKRFAAVVVDQAVLAATSFVLLFFAGRIGGLSDVGTIGLVQTAALVMVGFSRMLLFQPLMVDRVEMAFRSAFTVTLAIVAVAVAISFVLWLGNFSEYACIGIMIGSASLAQEFFRVRLLSVGLAWKVLISSIPLALIVCVAAPFANSILALTAVWLGAICATVLLGAFLAPSRLTRLGSAFVWLSGTPRALGLPLLVDGVLYTLVAQGSLIWLGAASGLEEIGMLRLASLLLGPIGVLAVALSNWVLPSTPPTGVLTRKVVVAVALTTMMSALVVILLVAISSLIAPLFGVDSVTLPAFRVVMALVGTSAVLAIAATGFQSSLKMVQRYWPLVTLRSVTSAVMVLLITMTPLGLGASGIAAMWSVQTALVLLVSWRVWSVVGDGEESR